MSSLVGAGKPQAVKGAQRPTGSIRLTTVSRHLFALMPWPWTVTARMSKHRMRQSFLNICCVSVVSKNRILTRRKIRFPFPAVIRGIIEDV